MRVSEKGVQALATVDPGFQGVPEGLVFGEVRTADSVRSRGIAPSLELIMFGVSDE